jgi:hypothetical protein
MDGKKRLIKPEEEFNLSLQLAKKIWNGGYRPTHIVALWRGGCVPGTVVQSYFKKMGLACDHIAIRTSSYKGKEQSTPEVYNLGYLSKAVTPSSKILFIDDIFDSGRTMDAVIHALAQKPECKVGVLFSKPANRKVSFVPDYWVEETDKWLVFPHEIDEMTDEEFHSIYDVEAENF